MPATAVAAISGGVSCVEVEMTAKRVFGLRCCASVLVFPMMACHAAIGTASSPAVPRENVPVAYQSFIYSSDGIPTGANAVFNEGDGFISPFSLRLLARRGAIAEIYVRNLAEVDASPPQRILLRLDEAAWPAPGWRARPVDAASLVLRIANLDLPPGRAGDLAAFYRRATAAGRWPWMAEGITRNGRDVMVALDLRTEDGQAAALCRSIPIQVLEDVASDRCTIEAIVEGATGWPFVARISRRAEAANRASTSESITFERVPSQ